MMKLGVEMGREALSVAGERRLSLRTAVRRIAAEMREWQGRFLVV
jgi:hypothetical protein